MALTITVTRGYTMVAGAKPSVDDWNAAFLPSITIEGLVGSTDLADDAIVFAALNPNFILGGEVITEVALDDMLLIGDASAGDNAVATFRSVLQSAYTVGGYPENISNYKADLLLVWNVADGNPDGMSVERFLSKCYEQIDETTTVEQDDTILVRDTSEVAGEQIKRVSMRNALPDVIAATTVNNPTQIVVDSKGRVTSVSGTAGGSDQCCFLRDTGAHPYSPQSVLATTLTPIRLTDASTVSWLTLDTNTFTVDAGTYELDAVIPVEEGTSAGRYTLMVYDATTGGGTVVATSSLAFKGDDDVQYGSLKAVFTVATQVALTLRIYGNLNCSVGVAVANGYDETYTQVLLRRLA